MKPAATLVVHLDCEPERARRCLLALAALAPTPEHEAIVVDDGAAGLAPLLAGLEGDVRVLRNERREGLAAAAARAAGLARGEVLVLLHGAPELEPGALGPLLAALRDPGLAGAAAAPGGGCGSESHPVAARALALRREDAAALGATASTGATAASAAATAAEARAPRARGGAGSTESEGADDQTAARVPPEGAARRTAASVPPEGAADQTPASRTARVPPEGATRRTAARVPPELELAAICADLAAGGRRVETVAAGVAQPAVASAVAAGVARPRGAPTATPAAARPALAPAAAPTASPAVAARTEPGRVAELTIVVPTLDATSPRVRACLAAIAAATAAPHLVVVVDNGAPPQGFTAPVNAGLRAAETAYAVVMNDDVEVLPGWWPPLREALDAGAEVAFPLTVEGGMRTDFAAWCFAIDQGTITAHGHAPGQFFDPALRVWYQDTDLLQRLRAAGNPPRLVPESRIRHGLSTTVGSPDPALRAWVERTVREDRAAFLRKHPDVEAVAAP